MSANFYIKSSDLNLINFNSIFIFRYFSNSIDSPIINKQANKEEISSWVRDKKKKALFF